MAEREPFDQAYRMARAILARERAEGENAETDAEYAAIVGTAAYNLGLALAAAENGIQSENAIERVLEHGSNKIIRALREGDFGEEFSLSVRALRVVLRAAELIGEKGG